MSVSSGGGCCQCDRIEPFRFPLRLFGNRLGFLDVASTDVYGTTLETVRPGLEIGSSIPDVWPDLDVLGKENGEEVAADELDPTLGVGADASLVLVNTFDNWELIELIELIIGIGNEAFPFGVKVGSRQNLKPVTGE